MLTALALIVGQAVARDGLLELHGFVDAYYGFDSNHPADHVSFAAGAGTTAQRAGELRLNLAALDVLLDPRPVGVHVSLGYGTGIDALHAAESFLGPVYQAYATVRVGRLVLDAGIFSSHVGFETFFSKDNLDYTRSWMGEFSPYYEAGVRATYSFDDRWSAQLLLLKNWRARSPRRSASRPSLRGTLIGPELPRDDTHFRFFGDLVAQIRVLEWLTLAATADAAFQQPSTHWAAAAAYARAALSKLVALAVRVEQFSDPDGAISGMAQTLREGTATLELTPFERLVLKLEARHDWSTAPIFHTLTDETLVIASAVASF